MPSPNEKPAEAATSLGVPPAAGERAKQLVDDAFRMVRLTRECGIPARQDKDGLPSDVVVHLPAGPAVDATMVRVALMMFAVHYNLGGSEVVDMARYASWRLQQEAPR